MIQFTTSGSFHNTDKFLEEMSKGDAYKVVEEFAAEGDAALAAETPQKTGLTAESWYHEVHHNRRSITILWMNSNKDTTGTPIPILIEFGHGTREGGYVQGFEFINRALEPIYARLADEVWKAVTSA